MAGNAGTPLVLNPISTLSAGLAIELPFLMSAATGNPTNRALITNMDFAVIPSAISPGVSLAQFIPFGAAVPPQAQSPSPLAALPFNLNIPFFDINRFGLPGQGLGTTPTANTGANTPGVGAGGVTQQPLQQAQQLQQLQAMQQLQQVATFGNQGNGQFQQQPQGNMFGGGDGLNQVSQFQQQPQGNMSGGGGFNQFQQFQPQGNMSSGSGGFNQFQQFQPQGNMSGGGGFNPFSQFQPQGNMFGPQFMNQAQFQQPQSNPFGFNMGGGGGGFNSNTLFANNQSSFSPMMSQSFSPFGGGFPMNNFGPVFRM